MNEREDIVMDILEIMKERHSVRQYKNQAIEPSKREEISSLIMMSMRRVDYPFRLFRRTEMFWFLYGSLWKAGGYYAVLEECGKMWLFIMLGD